MRTDIERARLYSVPELRAKGWTLSAIAHFLPTHDDERSNPVHPDGSAMRFYRRGRVELIEHSQEFRDWRSSHHNHPVRLNKHTYHVIAALLAHNSAEISDADVGAVTGLPAGRLNPILSSLEAAHWLECRREAEVTGRRFYQLTEGGRLECCRALGELRAGYTAKA
jgi:hypothetical protein